MSNYKEIIYKEIDGIGIVTLNRPERLNSIGMNLSEEFCEISSELSKNKSIRVVVLTGSGRSFSTGRDLKESANHSEEEANLFQDNTMSTSALWESLPMPTIAAVNGHAFGWGGEITLACDFRFVSNDATLCLPECRLGIFPGGGGVVRLQRLIPIGLAKELIYTSKSIDGREAERIGLANRSFEKDVLMKEVMKVAEQIRDNGPLGVQGAKFVIDQTIGMKNKEALDISHKKRKPLNFTKDFKEALLAFKEKRTPDWKDK